MSILKMRDAMKRGAEKPVYWILLIAFVVSCFAGYGAYTSLGGRKDASGSYATETAAIVNGIEIPAKDLEIAFERAWDEQKQSPYGAPNIMMEEMTRGQTLQQLIDRVLFVDAAKKAGIKVSGEDVNKQIDELVKNKINQQKGNASDADFDKFLKDKRGISLDQLKKQMRKEYEVKETRQEIVDDLYITKFIESIQKGTRLSDAEFQRSFKVVTARIIAIPARGITDDQARKQVSDIKKMAEKGQDFAALAKKYSKDTVTASKGGLMDPITPKMTTGDTGLEKLLFNDPVGKITGPEKTMRGWAIAKIEKAETKYPEDFAKKRAELRKEALNEKIRNVMNEKYNSIRESAKIEIKDPLVNAFDEFQKAMQMPMDTPDARTARQAAIRKVIKTYEKAYEKTRRPVIWARIGSIYRSYLVDARGKPELDKALIAYNKAEREISDPVIYMALADLYAMKGNKKKAIEELKLASDAAYGPGSDFIHTQLREEYKKLGATDLVAKEDQIIKEMAEQQAAEQARQQQMMQEAMKAQQEQQKKAAKDSEKPKGGR